MYGSEGPSVLIVWRSDSGCEEERPLVRGREVAIKKYSVLDSVGVSAESVWKRGREGVGERQRGCGREAATNKHTARPRGRE